MLEMRFPYIAIATAALWFAFGDCVILRDGKEACVVLLVGVRCGVLLLDEIWSRGLILAACEYTPSQTRRRADAQTRRRADAQTRRRADAQTLPDELFVAKALKTQFTAVLILR